MLALVKSLPSRTGCSIVLSSHLLHDVEKVCERAILLHEGKIVYSGTIEALRKEGQKDVYELRVKDGEDRMQAGAGEARAARRARGAPVGRARARRRRATDGAPVRRRCRGELAGAPSVAAQADAGERVRARGQRGEGIMSAAKANAGGEGDGAQRGRHPRSRLSGVHGALHARGLALAGDRGADAAHVGAAVVGDPACSSPP